MNTFIHADIFFFITSIAVAVLTIIFIIVLFYLIQILVNVRDISKILKDNVSNANKKLEELLEILFTNPFFRFFFRNKKKKKYVKKVE